MNDIIYTMSISTNQTRKFRVLASSIKNEDRREAKGKSKAN